MRLFVFLLLLIPLNVLSQSDTHNFKIEGNEFIWQRVFHTDLSFDQLIGELRSRGMLQIDEVNTDSKMITGHFSDIRPDVRGAGLSDLTTPMYASRVTAFGNVRIDYKDNRYRVTVSRIKVALINSLEILRNTTDYHWLAYYAVSGNKIDKKFLKRGAVAYNYTFIKMFNQTSETSIVLDDNW